MTTIQINRSVVEQALEVLDRAGSALGWQAIGQVERELRTALAEPDVDPCIDGSCDCCWTDKESQNKAEQPAEQEPVAWSVFDKRTKKHWYTHDSKYTAQHYSNEYSHREPDGTPHNVVVPLYASPQPAKQPREPSVDGVLIAVEEAIRNGDCPWQIEQAFDEYEAERRNSIKEGS